MGQVSNPQLSRLINRLGGWTHLLPKPGRICRLKTANYGSRDRFGS